MPFLKKIKAKLSARKENKFMKENTWFIKLIQK